MAKFVPKVVEPILNYVPSDVETDIVAYASAAMRLKIIADRNTRGFEKADRKGGSDAYEFESSKVATRKEEKDTRKQIEEARGNNTLSTEGYISEEPRLSRAREEIKSYIAIVDLDFKPVEPGNHYRRYYRFIQLPFVPRVLQYNPDSSFVGIASFGRNNPYYQYTGSEDTLTFEIDWFSSRNNRQDVIFNCRWIEALTKGDGYDDTPHRVKLVWGDQDNMFDGSVWLVVSAPYTLSEFVNAYRENGEVVRVGMLPQQAKQQVTLKKLTPHNLETHEIIGNLVNVGREKPQ